MIRVHMLADNEFRQFVIWVILMSDFMLKEVKGFDFSTFCKVVMKLCSLREDRANGK